MFNQNKLSMINTSVIRTSVIKSSVIWERQVYSRRRFSYESFVFNFLNYHLSKLLLIIQEVFLSKLFFRFIERRSRSLNINHCICFLNSLQISHIRSNSLWFVERSWDSLNQYLRSSAKRNNVSRLFYIWYLSTCKK